MPFSPTGRNTIYGWAQTNPDFPGNTKIENTVHDDAGNSVKLDGGAFSSVTPPVPEASTLALLATGAAGVLALRRRRRKSDA